MSYSPGVYEGISNKEYHADPALGSTSLKTLALRTPAHWKWERENPVHKDAYDIGTAAHSLILEDDDSQLVLVEANDWKTKAAQAEKAKARSEGKIALLPKELAQVKAMRDSAMAHPLARNAFTNHRAEESVFWEEDGQMFKCRPDAWKQGLVVDLKTSADADPNEFGKVAYNFGYFMSAPHYVDGIKKATGEEVKFAFVNVEKSPPYLVSVTELTESDMNRGRFQLDRAKRIYRECMASGNWPGYPAFTTVSMPIWAQNNLDEMEFTDA